MNTSKARRRAAMAGILLAGCWPACPATFAGTILVPHGLVTRAGADAVACPADYDGDGLADPALYQAASGHWRAFLSGRGYADNGAPLGGPGFEPILGDFDGDSISDPAVYNKTTGEWQVLLSAGSYQIAGAYLGGMGYNPVASDYDGDGLAELAVYQPATGQWIVWFHEDEEVTDLGVLAGMYSNAMVNASNVVASKIRNDLAPITADNTNLIWRTHPGTGAREVLVASYMSTYAATHFYNVGEYSTFTNAEAWITLVPELKNFCRNYAGTNLYLRLKQLLGLPATSANDSIVEYYVDPQFLLRPSRDPEITDREAEVAFRANTPYADKVSTNYSAWFQTTIESRNYGMTNGVWNAYPWTQLGYTYDWLKTGNNVAGLSEFVVPGRMLYTNYGSNVMVYVVSITNAANYATVPNDLFIKPQGTNINTVQWDDR